MENNNIDLVMADTVDQKDVCFKDGQQLVSIFGMIKMAAAGAYFHPSHSGMEKCSAMLERFIAAGRKKGWVKGDVLRTAFSMQYPPSQTARALADELGGLFLSCEEVDHILNSGRDGVAS